MSQPVFWFSSLSIKAIDALGVAAVVQKLAEHDEYLKISINVEIPLRLVQVCPAVVPQFFTSWAHQAQYATHAQAFLLGFFRNC